MAESERWGDSPPGRVARDSPTIGRVLLLPVRIDRSLNHGLGVFAIEPIPKGTEIWRFTPGFDLDLPVGTLDAQPAHFRDLLLHYGYVDPRLGRFILACDDARFLNHSDTPNLGSDYARDRYGVDFALRDIAAGEELTVDYRLIDAAGSWC